MRAPLTGSERYGFHATPGDRLSAAPNACAKNLAAGAGANSRRHGTLACLKRITGGVSAPQRRTQRKP